MANTNFQLQLQPYKINKSPIVKYHILDLDDQILKYRLCICLSGNSIRF